MKSKEIQDKSSVVLVLGVYWVCVGCVLVDIWHSGYMPYMGWYFGYYYYYYDYCLVFNPIVGCLLLSVELCLLIWHT